MRRVWWTPDTGSFSSAIIAPEETKDSEQQQTEHSNKSHHGTPPKKVLQQTPCLSLELNGEWFRLLSRTARQKSLFYHAPNLAHGPLACKRTTYMY